MNKLYFQSSYLPISLLFCCVLLSLAPDTSISSLLLENQASHFISRSALCPHEGWPGTEPRLKPGNGPGRYLTIRFSQHSKYLGSLCLDWRAHLFFFFPFEGENLGNLSPEKMIWAFSACRGKRLKIGPLMVSHVWPMAARHQESVGNFTVH